MIIRLIIASVIVVAPAAFAAGYWESQHQDDLPSTVNARLNAPILTKPGAGSADAAKYLSVLNTPPPPPPPPGLAPPDVGVTFRREITGVTTDKIPHVILAGGRQLVRGQEYRDGWKVRQISTESVTLAKGADQRSINLFSAPQAAPQVLPGLAGVGGFGQISLTNGEKPGQMPPGVVDRIIDQLRQLGLSQAQLDQLRRTLTTGLTQQAAVQMIQTALRGRTATQAQITNLIQTFVGAGVIPQNTAIPLTQQLFTQQQNQQVQGIFNGGGGGGFGGGRGGGGRGGRGGPFGLTPPRVAPGEEPAAAPLPGPTTPAPVLPPTAQRDEGAQGPRLALLAGHSYQDRAIIL